MKTLVSLLMVAFLLNATVIGAQTTPSAPEVKSCEESQDEGTADADSQHSSVGWWIGGVGSGILLGLIGTGIIWGVSFASNPQPGDIPEDVKENCYRQGYKKEAKGSNKMGAGVGGLIGTAALVLVVLTANSGK